MGLKKRGKVKNANIGEGVGIRPLEKGHSFPTDSCLKMQSKHKFQKVGGLLSNLRECNVSGSRGRFTLFKTPSLPQAKKRKG